MVRKSTKNSEIVVHKSIDPEMGISLIRKQIDKAREMLSKNPLDKAQINSWEMTTKDYLIKAFGSQSSNVNDVLYASGNNGLHIGMSDYEFDLFRVSKLENQIVCLQSCIEQLETEIEIANTKIVKSSTDKLAKIDNYKVFIVHGHTDLLKESTARFLQQLNLETIILHEKPNIGRTIIEKFSDYSDVGYAIVLLTADDIGNSSKSKEEPKLRARQNVIFELGYFIGKLGRERVCAIYEEGVEIPSDYHGVLFIPWDERGKWKYDVFHEMKAVGYELDANRLF